MQERRRQRWQEAGADGNGWSSGGLAILVRVEAEEAVSTAMTATAAAIVATAPTAWVAEAVRPTAVMMAMACCQQRWC